MNDLKDSFKPKAGEAVHSPLDFSEVWQDFLDTQRAFEADSTYKLNKLLREVPPALTEVALQMLTPALRQKDPVSFEKHALAVWFTVSRVKALMDEGTEEMILNGTKTHVNGTSDQYFEAYIDSKATPAMRPIIIEDNFTIQREGKPFIYKAKYQPARHFGSASIVNPDKPRDERNAYHDRNLVLKYQAAIEHGLISGACIEVRGLIDLDFLTWACGTNAFNRGAIPDVQIIYNMMLPSGAEYRFTLKKAGELARELDVRNPTDKYTPEDLEIVRGIECALDNPTQHEIHEIVSATNILSPKLSLHKYFNDNGQVTYDQITNRDEYKAFIDAKRKAIWAHAAAIKPERYNQNADTVFSEENTGLENDPVRMGEIVERYQAYLRENPHIARMKTNYLMGTPGTSQYDANKADVVAEFAKNLAIVRAREIERRASPEYQALADERAQLQWSGPDEGYGLSVEHIMLDSTVQVISKRSGKHGRSYDDADSRFMSIDQVMDHLDREKNRDVYQIKYHDPLATKIDKLASSQSIHYQDETEAKVQQLQAKARKVNINRAIDFIFGGGPAGKKKKSDQMRKALKSGGQRAIEQYVESLRNLREEVDGMGKAIAMARDTDGIKVPGKKGKTLPEDHPILQRRSELMQRIEDTETALWDTLSPMFDKGQHNKMFARVISKHENIMKFIYAVRPDNTLMFAEESRHSNLGRPSHSEINAGMNTYGAGEMIFTRCPGKDSWVLKEINNGSGHYIPPATSLAFTSQCFGKELHGYYMRQGLDIDAADAARKTFMCHSRLTDAIARGRQLRDAEHKAGDSSKILEVVRANISSSRCGCGTPSCS